MKVTGFFGLLAGVALSGSSLAWPGAVPEGQGNPHAAPHGGMHAPVQILWARASYGTMNNTPKGWKEGEQEMDAYVVGTMGCQLFGHSAANKSTDRNAVVRCYDIANEHKEVATFGCATAPGTATNGACVPLPLGTTRQMIREGKVPTPKPMPQQRREPAPAPPRDSKPRLLI